MTRGDLIIARLIVWEGTLPVDTFRKKIQEYTNALRFVIDKALENTQWRYQIWRLRTGATTDQQRLEVCLPLRRIKLLSEPEVDTSSTDPYQTSHRDGRRKVRGNEHTMRNAVDLRRA